MASVCKQCGATTEQQTFNTSCLLVSKRHVFTERTRLSAFLRSDALSPCHILAGFSETYNSRHPPSHGRTAPTFACAVGVRINAFARPPSYPKAEFCNARHVQEPLSGRPFAPNPPFSESPHLYRWVQNQHIWRSLRTGCHPGISTEMLPSWNFD